jgi:hypothetical protein
LILNDYHQINNKKDYIISIEDFYNKYKKFDIHLYKDILILRNNLFFKNTNDYLYHWYNNNRNKYYNDYINDFYNIYPEFNINIYKCFNKNIIDKKMNELILMYDFYNKIKNNIINISKIIYSKKSFYSIYSKFNKDLYIYYNNLQDYSEEEVIIHYYKIGLKLNLSDKKNNINLLNDITEFNDIQELEICLNDKDFSFNKYVKINLIKIKNIEKPVYKINPKFTKFINDKEKYMKYYNDYIKRLNEWRDKVIKISQTKLIDLVNTYNTRQEIIKFIFNHDPNNKFIDLLKTNFKLEKNQHEYVMNVKNDINNIYYWITRWKDTTKEKLISQKPILENNFDILFISHTLFAIMYLSILFV